MQKLIRRRRAVLKSSIFAEAEEIDTIYYDTPYYLEPEKGAGKAYILLREALKRSKKVAIGIYVLRNHEHIGVIKPYGDLLVLNQLRYEAELVKPKDLNVPKEKAVGKKELEIALQLIDQLTAPFKAKNYSDIYTDELKALIKKKAKGKRVVVKKGKEPKSPKVHDIMTLLKQSLEKKRGKKIAHVGKTRRQAV